jgi:phage internal scaffolding protein
MAIVIRKPYDGKRHRVSMSFLDEEGNPAVGRTEQHHKSECDIDTIIRKYDKTGLITHVNSAVAQYGDFTDVNEYQVSLNMVIDAQNAFNELPSAIRKKFGNDPGEFFEFATDPDNYDELVKLGLANAKEVEKPVENVEKTSTEGVGTVDPT